MDAEARTVIGHEEMYMTFMKDVVTTVVITHLKGGEIPAQEKKKRWICLADRLNAPRKLRLF